MIKSLRESKAHLSELVERASRGEEIVITVHGKAKARLVPMAANEIPPNDDWGRQLREVRKRYSTRCTKGTDELLDDLRGERM